MQMAYPFSFAYVVTKNQFQLKPCVMFGNVLGYIILPKLEDYLLSAVHSNLPFDFLCSKDT
jgi:hypothetical protein